MKRISRSEKLSDVVTHLQRWVCVAELVWNTEAIPRFEDYETSLLFLISTNGNSWKNKNLCKSENPWLVGQ